MRIIRFRPPMSVSLPGRFLEFGVYNLFPCGPQMGGVVGPAARSPLVLIPMAVFRWLVWCLAMFRFLDISGKIAHSDWTPLFSISQSAESEG